MAAANDADSARAKLSEALAPECNKHALSPHFLGSDLKRMDAAIPRGWQMGGRQWRS